MQRMQRKVGTLLKRSEDDKDVGTALQEFALTDKNLDKFIENVKAFQTAWGVVLQRQLGIAQEFETLYRPLDDQMDPGGAGRAPSSTPKSFLDKCAGLRATYEELQVELRQDTSLIETKLLRPAWDIKESIAPLKKDIKRRENSKLDFERYSSRVEASMKKENRSAKEEAALAKHESDLNQATYEYHAADDQLRKVLPAVVDAISRLTPYLLTIQVMLQHAMVAQLYTVLHAYCQQFHFPNPAPPMEQVVATWDAEFTPLRGELESSLQSIANGKAVRAEMHPPERIQGSSMTGLGLRNKVHGDSVTGMGIRNKASSGDSMTGMGIRNKLTGKRTNSQGSIPSTSNMSPSQQVAVIEDDEDELPPAKPPRNGPGRISLGDKPRIPSFGQTTPSLSKPPTPYEQRASGLVTPGSPWANGGSRRSSPSTPFLTPLSGGSHSSQGEYFGRAERQQSSPSMASTIAAKKKPPPPPVKRIPSSSQDQFVDALYDFVGQSDGDLSFSEGDRIKILKKSDSTDDWWLGEVRGVKGAFPANYVR